MEGSEKTGKRHSRKGESRGFSSIKGGPRVVATQRNQSWSNGAAQPVKETQHTNLTVNSSWAEIQAELEQILRQLRELKEDENQ